MIWGTAIITLLIAPAFAFRAYEQRQVAKRIEITSPNGIASLEKVRLGGVDQWILIRGRNRDNPVLLLMHGGPGFPCMPFAHVTSELEKRFVVVHWDQRGAGKSYSSSIPTSSMNMKQFVADTHLSLRPFVGFDDRCARRGQGTRALLRVFSDQPGGECA